MTQHGSQSVDGVMRLELAECPRGNAAHTRDIVLSHDTNERWYRARRIEMTDRCDSGIANGIRFVPEKFDDRLECLSVLDASQCPCRIRAHVGCRILESADERIHRCRSFDQAEPERGDSAHRHV